jgi:hypothetical protein
MVFLGAATAALAIAVTHGTAANIQWMSAEAMRQEFVGKTLDGHYGNGTTWSESYANDGRIEYRERARMARGSWSFRGPVFCTFYDSQYRPQFQGGCWLVLKTGPNCYEFYVAPSDEPDAVERVPRRWNARGWRNDVPATCKESPSV